MKLSASEGMLRPNPVDAVHEAAACAADAPCPLAEPEDPAPPEPGDAPEPPPDPDPVPPEPALPGPGGAVGAAEDDWPGCGALPDRPGAG